MRLTEFRNGDKIDENLNCGICETDKLTKYYSVCSYCLVGIYLCITKCSRRLASVKKEHKETHQSVDLV